MAIFKKILLAFVVLIVLLLIGAFLLPSSSHVERSATIDAPLCTARVMVSDLKRFQEWSPWADRDPDAVYTYEMPRAGAGASVQWKGDDRVGEGTMKVVAVEEKEVRMTLDFGSQGTANSAYRLEPVGEQTEVTWVFDTELGNNPISRYMGLMMDTWIGADYEEGLANLRQLAASLPQSPLPKSAWCDLESELVEVEARPIAYIDDVAADGAAAAGQARAAAFERLGAFLGEQQLEPGGLRLAIVEPQSADEGSRFDVAIPLAAEPSFDVAEAAGAGIELGHTYAGSAIKVVHQGPLSELPTTYQKAQALLAAHGVDLAGRAWEEYLGGADEVTFVYFPINV